MVDSGRVARLLRDVEGRIARLDSARLECAEHEGDLMWLDAIKYLFVTAIEGCTDVAHHVAASERWEAPDTNAQSFAILQRHDVVDVATSHAMASASGFRNVLVHRYVDVDDARVLAALDELGSLRRFVEQVSAWVLRHGGD